MLATTIIITRPCRLRVRYERAGRSLLLGRRSGRRQDEARSDREWKPKSRRRTRPLLICGPQTE
jgi:hypothetical protein